MKAKELRYKTTITGISKVVLNGDITFDDDGWLVGGDPVDYWLERIEKEGSRVTVTIEAHNTNEDDSEIVQPGLSHKEQK